MFGPTRYLAWARRYYGRVRFDLASSGATPVPLRDLVLPPRERLDDPEGWSDLRAAIANYNAVPGDEAVAALGTTAALWLAYAALTSPGDAVLIESPSYEPLWRIAEGMGLEVQRFERPAAQRFALDPERVAKAMTSRTKVVVVSNLHNPSGVRASDATLRAVAGVAASHGATLLVDEVYAPFDRFVDDEGVFRTSARALSPNVVAVSSLSKAYGLGAQRIGWMLGSRDVVARAEDALLASMGSLPLVHAHVGLAALAQVPALASRTKSALAGKRARVGDWVAAQGMTWSAPDEGLFGFVHVPGSGDLTSFIEEAAIARHVLVAPGAFFGAPEGFRLAWSAPQDTLEAGLDALADVLRTRQR